MSALISVPTTVANQIHNVLVMFFYDIHPKFFKVEPRARRLPHVYEKGLHNISVNNIWLNNLSV
jgi:hypothetical protein